MPIKPIRPRRDHAFGDLYELLESKFPTLRTDRDAFDVQAFAQLLGYSMETVYKALREFQPMQLTVAARILEASHANQLDAPLYWEDLIPYCLPRFTDYQKPTGDTSDDDLLG